MALWKVIFSQIFQNNSISFYVTQWSRKHCDFNLSQNHVKNFSMAWLFEYRYTFMNFIASIPLGMDSKPWKMEINLKEELKKN